MTFTSCMDDALTRFCSEGSACLPVCWDTQSSNNARILRSTAHDSSPRVDARLFGGPALYIQPDAVSQQGSSWRSVRDAGSISVVGPFEREHQISKSLMILHLRGPTYSCTAIARSQSGFYRIAGLDVEQTNAKLHSR